MSPEGTEWLAKTANVRMLGRYKVEEWKDIKKSDDECTLTMIDITELGRFRQWYKSFLLSTSRIPTNWRLEFNQDIYDMEDVTDVDIATKMDAEIKGDLPVSTDVVKKSGMIAKSSPRISDYPKFDGRINQWFNFKEEFAGTAFSQGFGSVLDSDNNDESDDFVNASKFIYSVLRKCCAGGTAAAKVKRFERTMSGQLVWKELVEYYESNGSRAQLVLDITGELERLKLRYNAHGGIEKYIADFKFKCLQLEEEGRRRDRSLGQRLRCDGE